MKAHRHLPFWLFAISCIIFLTLSVLIQDGMFMDAVLYTSVAHNQSIGVGTFWFPQYSTLNIAGIPSFHEQPPLMFGIVSLFFRALGDSIYVERFYTFITLIITMLLMTSLWRELCKDNPVYKKYIWAVFVLWISIPCIYWAYSNNMCENTMGIFALCSVLLSYKTLRSGKDSILSWVLSGAFIFLATFTKGFPAFFPVCVPVLYFLIVRSGKLSRAVRNSVILTAVPLLIYAILFSIPVSRESLSIYLFKRAFHRIGNDPTVEYRVDVLYRIFCQLIPPLIIMLLLFLVAQKKKIAYKLQWANKQAWFFIAVGLSASAPLVLTLVQKDIYLIPSYPYFAIGMTAMVLPVIVHWVEAIDLKKNAYKILLVVNLIYFACSLVFLGWRYGQVNREQDTIHDVYMIGKVVPKFATMTVPPEMYNEFDFVLHGFLMRYDNISISPYKQYEYFLIEKKLHDPIPANYSKVALATKKYDLYRRRE
jgi:hypothetical protein